MTKILIEVLSFSAVCITFGFVINAILEVYV
jgi:hypothetical protein